MRPGLLPAAALAALLLAPAIGFPGPASAVELTAEDCAADREAYLAQAESNRMQRVAELTEAMAETDDPELLGRFAAERERAWSLEEERRGQAFAIYRECMEYVRKPASTGG